VTMPQAPGGADPLSTFFGQTSGGYAAGLNQQMQMFLQALQFQQQQAALQGAQSLGTQFGYAPGGSWSQWPLSQQMQPLPGTPTQAMQSQAMQNALAAAGVTGQFTNPSTFMYQPGTFVRNRDDGGIGQIQANGSLRIFGSMPEYLAAGGTQDAVGKMPQLSAAEFGNLTNTNNQTPQNTMQAAALTGMYQGAPTTAYAQQLAALAGQGAGLTGTYYDPTQMRYQPGTFVKDADTGGIGQIMANGQLRMFGSMDEFTAAGGTHDMIAGLPSVNDQQYQQLANQGQVTGQTTLQAEQMRQQLAQQWAQMYGQAPSFDAQGNPIAPSGQTLQSINQAATLSGMYQGAPTETAREFNQQQAQQLQEFQQNLALQQGQLGQQYLSTASQLQGPQNTFQLSNYLRGAQGNPNVPVYLQNLAGNVGTPAFQATGTTAPTPNSIGGLQAQMGGQNQNYYTGQPGQGGGGPGWDYNSTLNQINQIAQRGAQGLAPGSLERLTPDELQAFGSGLGAAGYSLPSFMTQYQQSRIGQQAPIGRTSLA